MAVRTRLDSRLPEALFLGLLREQVCASWWVPPCATRRLFRHSRFRELESPFREIQLVSIDKYDFISMESISSSEAELLKQY